MAVGFGPAKEAPEPLPRQKIDRAWWIRRLAALIANGSPLPAGVPGSEVEEARDLLARVGLREFEEEIACEAGGKEDVIHEGSKEEQQGQQAVAVPDEGEGQG